LTAAQIETPFWTLISDPKWKNVDHDMKEALDRRDSAKDDAAFFALKALESTIEIVSDDLRVTRGTERGASEYIDNLVGSQNGRYIEVWEAEALKQLFRKIRNAQGHGPGSAKPLLLTIHQSTFVIETAMAWVKSLVRRKPLFTNHAQPFHRADSPRQAVGCCSCQTRWASASSAESGV